MKEIVIDKKEIDKLFPEVRKDLAQGLVTAYIKGHCDLVTLLANARYYGLEDLIDWENLSKPKHLIEENENK